MTRTMTLHGRASRARLLVLGGALLSVLALGAPAGAQPPGGRGDRGGQMGPGGRGGDPEHMIERRVARLTEELQLSEAQATRIRAILADQHAGMEALRPAQRPDTRPDSAERARMRAATSELHEQTNAAIESVLTAEQRARFEEIEAARGPGARGMGRGGRGGPPSGARGQRPPPPVE